MNAKFWKLYQLHDPFILAPPTDTSTWATTIKRRVASFLSGDWAPLLRDLACRNPGFRPPQPTSDDPKDIRALQANRLVMRNGDIGAAAAALRAPARPPPAAPGQITKPSGHSTPKSVTTRQLSLRLPIPRCKEVGTLKLTGKPKH